MISYKKKKTTIRESGNDVTFYLISRNKFIGLYQDLHSAFAL